MFSVREKFPAGMKFFQIPLSWFRAVSAWINNFSAGTGIRFTAPSAPSGNNPVVVSIDEDYLRSKVAELAPASSGAAGASDAATQHVDMSSTSTEDVEGILDADIAFVSGSTMGQMDARAAATAKSDEWAAGRQADLVKYEIARWQPYYYYTDLYVRVFARKCVYAPSGRLLSVGPEVDCGISLQAYRH